MNGDHVDFGECTLATRQNQPYSIGLAHKLRTPNEGLTQQNQNGFGPKLAFGCSY